MSANLKVAERKFEVAEETSKRDGRFGLRSKYGREVSEDAVSHERALELVLDRITLLPSVPDVSTQSGGRKKRA